MLPPGFLQDLLSRVDIVEVVGRHVTLKKAGIHHKGLCPFHGEKTPSFTVSPSRQTYHCFGCGAHGDAIRFLTEHTGAGFMEAVRELAGQVGLVVPDDRATPEDRARAAAEKARQATLTDVLAKAGAHWRKALKDSPRAVDYLKRRGLTGQIAARFGLGYAPEGWRTLAGVFAHYDDPLLTESGLVIATEPDPAQPGSDGKRYDRFRDRIMFPIRNVRGEVIGFGGRVLDKGEPKYLNSPETPVFHKGQELYGLYEARTAIRKAGCALVVEGYMDVVALAQSGIEHAVATLGTACTAEHVAKLFRFTDTVVFSFDGDAAGRRAAGRALEAALPHAGDTRSVRFLFLPPEHDPDSFVRAHGRQAFEAAVAQAVPLSQQLLVQAAEGCDLDTAEGRARMLVQARGLIAPLPDGLLRAQLVQALAERGGLSAEALQAHWQSLPGGTVGSGRPAGRTGRDAAPASGADRGGWGGPAHGPTDAARDWTGDVPSDDGEGWAGHGPDGMAVHEPRRGGAGAAGFGGGFGGGFGSGRGGWDRPGRSGRSAPWGRGDGRQGGPARWAQGAGRRATPQAPTRLDRAAWLLARHPEQWHGLSDALHAWLCEQPAPHGPFFAALERLLHEQGQPGLAELLQALAAPGAPGTANLPGDRDAEHAPSGPDALADHPGTPPPPALGPGGNRPDHRRDHDPVLAPLLARIQRFDALDTDPPVSDLQAVLRQLELAEVADELSALTQAGALGEADLARLRALYERQRQLSQAETS